MENTAKTTKQQMVVIKFGGSTLGPFESADESKFEMLADIVRWHISQDIRPIVVISAFAGETKRLSDGFEKLNPLPPEVKQSATFRSQLQRLDVVKNRILKEYANAIVVGEQLAAAMFSAYLINHGVHSQSFQGWQLPIITDNNFYDANVLSVGTELIMNAVRRDFVPVICGFQGITTDRMVTMLGFNGTDYTATAVAAALKCPVVLYKDVDGIYTGNPKKDPSAKKLPNVSYEEMLKLAKDNESSPVHNKAVNAAQKAKIPIEIRGLNDYKNPNNRSIVCDTALIQSRGGGDK